MSDNILNRQMSPKKMILFSPAMYNLAETTRAIQIAKAIQGDFNVHFASYGGQFENYIEREGFPISHLEPTLTPDKIDYLYKVDQGQAFGYFFSTEEVRRQVANEIKLYSDLKPAAVVTGFNFSNNISTRVLGVPLIWVTQTTWMMEALFESGCGSYFDMLDFPPLNWLPESTLTWLSRTGMSLTMLSFRPFNTVARQYQLPQFHRIEEMWQGDFNLLAEPEGFSELQVPPSYHFIGPLIGRLDEPVPNEILEFPRDLPLVYFAMGSSGQPEVIARIITGFAGKPYRVIAPVKNLLNQPDLEIPPNVLVTGWLPADKVNPICDISVIHGGIGTVMTACLAGTPVVGVSMMPEQEANIDCLVRKGFAIRIRKNRLTSQNLCRAIDSLLADQDARDKALAFQHLTRTWDNPGIVREFFKSNFS